MSPLAPFAAQWPLLSALLDEALALPPQAREAWLNGLPADCAQHRDALRTLLSRQRTPETDDFLHSLPRLDLPGQPTGGEPGDGALVGAYRLIERVGQGGMGDVWLAERADGLVRRRVALKLPRVAWGDSFAERLGREREILAGLAHPHIARLYDAGTDAQGRPFLAMEFVQGQPIDRYCAERALSVRARLELLLQVMAAVAHAHARLVVHRDLKPGNILVTSQGQASLLDFGIAKLLDGEQTSATALTELCGRALTVDYASPEQIRGEPLGTASDIYSMGVVAFELLAGVRPHRRADGLGAAEMGQAIAKAPAPLASDLASDSSLRKALRGDLDAILNRALKKLPGERYSTMDGFAQDVRRWLAGEPVEARPDGFAYRASRFVGRHRWQVAAGTAVAVSLVCGTVVSAWQARQARAAAAEARIQTATAAAVKTFMERVFLVNSGNQSDPKSARETTARALLDQGAARLETDLRDAPEARLELYATLAGLYEDMDLPETAQSLAQKRVALAERLHDPRSLQAAQAQIALAEIFIAADQRPQGLALLAQAGASLQVLPPNAGSEAERARIELNIQLANAYERQAPADALPYIDRAVAAASANRFPPERVRALRHQGAVLTRLQRNADAQAAFREAAAMIEQDHAWGWNDIVDVYSSLADLENRAGERRQAALTYSRAIGLIEKGAGMAVDLPIVYKRLALSQYADGLYVEAVGSSRKAADFGRRMPEDTPLGLYPATLLGTHGWMLDVWGHPEEALSFIDEGLARIARQTARLRQPAPEHEGPLRAYRAQALTELGRLREAEEDLARSAGLIEDDRTGQAHFLRDARRAYWVAAGQTGKALDDFERAPRQTGPDRLAPVRWQVQHAFFEMAAGRAAPALDDALHALGTIQLDSDRAFMRQWEALALATLGQARFALGDAEAALAPLAQAEELERSIFDPALSLPLARLLLVEARVMTARHDLEGAARKTAQARAIRARHPGLVS